MSRQRHLPKQFFKAHVTVGLVALLLKRALVELLKAEGADEMLGMKLPEHGGHTAAGNRLVTAGAERPPFQVVVRLAVGLPLVVEE